MPPRLPVPPTPSSTVTSPHSPAALVEANGGPPPKDATRKPRSVSFGTGQDAVMDSLEDALLVAADDAPAEVVHALLGPFRGSEWLKTLLARPLVASIHGAAEQGKGRALARVQALIEHGADVNRDDGDDTPLQKAAYCGRSDLVRPLIAAGADPDLGRSIEDGRRWMTPLVYAVMCDDVASAKALLEAGASTDAWAATEGGFQSALSLASGRFTFHGAGKGLSTHAGNPDMVRLLLDFGAPIQPDRPPLMAISPVKAATISRSKDVLDLLLESHPPHEVIQEALFNSRGIHVDQEVRDKLMAAGGRLAA